MRQDTQPSRTLDTRDAEYTTLLLETQARWWKKALRVQAPYRWNLLRLDLRFVLDIGCGTGRNLIHLDRNGVGIDHNPSSVRVAKSRGVRAYTPDEFRQSEYGKSSCFDSILLSHVAEHMHKSEAVKLLLEYVPLLRPNGQVALITPQECGFRSDPTHIEFMDFESLRGIARAAGLTPVKEYSFPFPRFFGRVFKYNEFVSISRKP